MSGKEPPDDCYGISPLPSTDNLGESDQNDENDRILCLTRDGAIECALGHEIPVGQIQQDFISASIKDPDILTRKEISLTMDSKESLPRESADIQKEIHELPKTCVQSKDISEPKERMVIQSISLDKLMKENVILKKENEDLKKELRNQQNLIAMFMEKFPVSEKTFTSFNTYEFLQHNNKVDDVRAQKERPPKPAVSSSSFASESFTSMASLSTENASKSDTAQTVQHRIICSLPRYLLSSVPSSDTILNKPKIVADANAQFKKEASVENVTKSFDKIKTILKGTDERLSEAKLKDYTNKLTEFFMTEINYLNISSFIYTIIDYLRHDNKNYIQAVKEDPENQKFLPLSEICIVSALFEIEEKSQIYSQFQLIQNILTTIYHLLIADKNYNVYGLSSLCRIYTAICKRKNDLISTLELCAHILKGRIPSGPYLIATIASVWKQPFMLPTDQSEEVKIFLGSISVAVGRKTKKIDNNLWMSSIELLSKGLPTLPNINKVISLLKDKIIFNCIQKSHEKSWMITSSFAILAAEQPWEWTKKNIINEFILPNLTRFSREEQNEKAFALFCDLCVDVYSRSMPYDILMKYYRQESNKDNFVQEYAAMSLIKDMIINRIQIHGSLAVWIEKNYEKLHEEKFQELYKRKHMYYNKGISKSSDIVIT